MKNLKDAGSSSRREEFTVLQKLYYFEMIFKMMLIGTKRMAPKSQTRQPMTYWHLNILVKIVKNRLVKFEVYLKMIYLDRK